MQINRTLEIIKREAEADELARTLRIATLAQRMVRDAHLDLGDNALITECITLLKNATFNDAMKEQYKVPAGEFNAGRDEAISILERTLKSLTGKING